MTWRVVSPPGEPELGLWGFKKWTSAEKSVILRAARMLDAASGKNLWDLHPVNSGTANLSEEQCFRSLELGGRPQRCQKKSSGVG